MANYWTNIFISDSRNQQLLIVLKGDRDSTDGVWYVHNDYHGVLSTERGKPAYYTNPNTLYLLNGQGAWGIKLNNYKYNSGYVNMEGSYGTILQPWVLTFEPGDIAWDARQGIVKI